MREPIHRYRPCRSTRSTFAWDADTNALAEERKRQADVYVFCLLDHKEQATVDLLDVAQWKFFVITTERLNAELGEQKTSASTAYDNDRSVTTDRCGRDRLQ